MAGQPLTRDEEFLALFNAHQAILELMVSHDMEAVEQAPDAIRYLRWACRRVCPPEKVVKRLAVPGPVQTPEAAAGALHTQRERLALLDAILTSELHEVQDARARAA